MIGIAAREKRAIVQSVPYQALMKQIEVKGLNQK